MKKLEITPRIAAMLQKASEGIDPTSVSVYEAIAINTLPVKKMGLFNGAVLTESTLGEMADFVLKGGYVPIHVLHDQSYSLPVGKTIYAEKFDEEGLAQVRILFYVGNTEKDGTTLLVDKLETSTIEEVSIGFRSKHMLCSECGWDYNGPEATMMNFWENVCANDHIIGENGVHLSLSGLEAWNETSLVSLGAARGAKIVGRSKQLLGEKEYNRLAASGIDPDVKTLYATATPPENSMDVTKLVELNAATSGKLAVAEHTVKELTASVTTEKQRADAAQLAASQANDAKVKAEKDLADFKASTEATAVATTKADLDKARAQLFTRATKVAVAAGLTAPAETATLDDLIKVTSEAETKLSSLPVGGVANTAAAGAGLSTGTKSYASAASFLSN